ncbi:glycosyltransferase [Pedobacter sp. JY14-1]|uniref:glycosyltransferase n=1 Tax=Pedobacter sp. JY14-1 TaxID=3034151 RepID=UPI0023E240DB|nr:glycosyltransferase [Pedobacter sp. JY14-1]
MQSDPSPVLFSIIIPTFNRAEKLVRCLNSLVEQTFKNFEVIVCDDGSTDETSSVIDAFNGKLHLKYLCSENFGGPARPRNNGITASKGEYIAFLDSDDWWYSQKLERMLGYIGHYDLIYHDLDKYGPSGRLKGVINGRQINHFKEILVSGNGIPNSSVVISRALIQQVGPISEDVNLIAVEDTDYWIRVLKVSNKLLYVPQSLGAYWIDGNISISEKQISRQIYLMDKYKSDLSESELFIATSNLKYREARIYHRIKMYDQAVESYKQALSLPSVRWKFKAFVGFLGSSLRIKF